MKKLITLFLTLSTIYPSITLAADSVPENAAPQSTETRSPALRESAEFQKIIDEYKVYVSKVPVTVREEIIAYRKEIAKINKDKRSIYKKLSQESQDYLQKEQEYKKKLPRNKKGLINIEASGEKNKAG